MKMNILKVFLKFILVLLISPQIFSQTPCNSGFAGVFPCDNYDLIDAFDKALLSNRDGSDIWGWTDPLDGKEYALITFEDRTCFLDVTDPINPIYLGFLFTHSSSNFWRDIKVYNNHAFIVADNVGAHGMQVFDLTRLRNVTSPPQSFNADAVYMQNGGPSIGSCHNIVINESVGIAYLVGCRTANGGGPIMINISNPTNPTFAGQYTADGYSHDAQVVTYNGPDTQHVGKQIYIGSHETKVVILDVTTPSAPVKLSEAFYPNTAYTHQGWFDTAQQYFYVNDELDEINFGSNTRTMVFDFSDLDAPVFHSQFLQSTSSIDHNLYISGNLMYQANYRSGLRVFDITDVNNIQEAGYFDTYPQNNNTGFNGAWSVYPYFTSGNIIISDIERGLIIVRDTNTLGLTDNNTAELKVFPNPANHHLTITSNATISNVKIFNSLGQAVLEDTTSFTEKTIPIDFLSTGIYLITINNKVTKKLVINR